VTTKEMCERATRLYRERHPDKLDEKRRRYRLENPEKDRAQNIVNKAVAAGTMTRPDCCEACGDTVTVHGHHEDYSKPREVRWLCPACHARYHADLRARSEEGSG
jgi:hypothetical protein